MGWEESFLQDAVDTCTNASGEIEDCALFTIQDSSDYSNCNFTVPAALADENVVGAMSTMPGNPAIQYGPAYATKGATAGSGSITTTATSVASQATLSYAAGLSLSGSESVALGGIFVVSTGASFTPSTSSSVATTTTEAVLSAAAVITSAPVATAAADDDDEEFFTTMYSTSGQVVYEVIWAKTDVTVTETESATATGGAAKRHVHKHARRARR